MTVMKNVTAEYNRYALPAAINGLKVGDMFES